MSNTLQNAELECDSKEHSCDAIDIIIEPRMRDLGGFSVRRVIPFSKRKSVGPWVFFDHLGPATFEPGKGIDVRPHPHINLATVTYLFDGSMMHRDSLGTEQEITAGAINWMTAGKGIVHSERTPDNLRESGHDIHALQLWIALPEEYEETDPAFYHYPADSLPSVDLDGAKVRVMVGSAYGVESNVKTYSETIYCEIKIDKGSSIELPNVSEKAVYVVAGKLTANGTEINQHNMAVFNDMSGIEVKAEEDTHFVIIGGKPLGKRFIDWNFVSSSKDRIEKAKDDWRNMNFPKVPGEEDEFIPLPE